MYVYLYVGYLQAITMLDSTGVLRTFLHAQLGTTGRKKDHFATNSYYACVYIAFYFTRVC